MGVINTGVLIVTAILCTWLLIRKYREDKWISRDDQKLAVKISGLMENGGYSFDDIILLLERLSPKARATFAYLYVSSISKDKRLFGTVRRYIDMKAAGVVVPQKPKGKGL